MFFEFIGESMRIIFPISRELLDNFKETGEGLKVGVSLSADVFVLCLSDEPSWFYLFIYLFINT